ncbi:MAG: SEC-C metal-binding domain-containing protein [Tissierellales bacterium]
MRAIHLMNQGHTLIIPYKPTKTPIKIGRSDPCPCGSGMKYKKCCMGKDE